MAEKATVVGLGHLHTQMRITNRLLAAGLRERLQQNDVIKLLAGTGASHQEIADVLNTTSATVAVTLQRQRKKEKAAGG
jgi:DNA-directed RNA polymerase specialized sigma24 family protein